MAYVETANLTRSRSLAIQGFLFTCLLVLMAPIDIRFSGMSASFAALPLIGIYVWPRGADTALSAIFVFLNGILADILTGGPIGLWALIFLTTLVIIRPNKRSKEIRFEPLWIGFCAWWIVVVGIWMVVDMMLATTRLSWWGVILHLVTAILTFPLVYSAAQFARQFVTDPSDRAAP